MPIPDSAFAMASVTVANRLLFLNTYFTPFSRVLALQAELWTKLLGRPSSKYKFPQLCAAYAFHSHSATPLESSLALVDTHDYLMFNRVTMAALLEPHLTCSTTALVEDRDFA